MIRWPRRERRPSALDVIRSERWQCSACGAPHEGMMDLAAFAPDPWRGEPVYEDNAALRLDGDFLSEDFCVIGGRYFFVRCVLEIPVLEVARKFAFGCWGTLSRENFDRYIERFDESAFAGEGPWSSWLCNQLHDYFGTAPELCMMYPQLDRQRPVLKVANPDHRLARDQRDGISADQLLAIYRHYGHEVAA